MGFAWLNINCQGRTVTDKKKLGIAIIGGLLSAEAGLFRDDDCTVCQKESSFSSY